MRLSVRLWHMIAGVLSADDAQREHDAEARRGLYMKAREATRDGITDDPVAIPLLLNEERCLLRLLASAIERNTAIGKLAAKELREQLD